VLADPEYQFKEGAKVGGTRTSLGVPLLREGKPIGVIVAHRTSVRPFTDKQIELVQTFADQAVIAIENVRLFDEVQARTRELSEALDHQTATSEVLSVITRSPTDAQPVFDAIVQSAARLCEAVFGAVFLYDGDLLHVAATNNWTPEQLKLVSQLYPKRPGRSVVAGRAVLDGRIAHVRDVVADPSIRASSPRPGSGTPHLRFPCCGMANRWARSPSARPRRCRFRSGKFSYRLHSPTKRSSQSRMCGCLPSCRRAIAT